MPVIVRDSAFHADDLETDTANGSFVWVDLDTLERAVPDGHARLGLRLENAVDPARLKPHFDRLETIAISFPSFADGRGFSQARWLRRLGFEGRLRARGHVIADQYRHALRCGFDEIEIDDTLAERQGAHLWQHVHSADAGTYQDRLGISA